MKLAALTSGGKDSMLAMYLMKKAGHEIAFLLNMVPESSNSYMFHYPNANLVSIISQALEIPLISGKTKGEKEKELEDLKKLFEKAREKGISGIITGAIASNYQRQRIENLCRELGLISFSPLWNKTGEEIWKLLFENKFRVIITSVSAHGLEKSWLGREITRRSFEELKKIAEKYRFHLAFEGGEAETFVADMPLYKKRIEIEEAEITWHSNHGFLKIKKASLVEK